MRPELIIADPAWKYNNRREFRRDNPERKARFGMGASARYLTEPTEQMATIPVSDLAADRAHLYMWVTGPFMPAGVWLMERWGFTFKTIAFTWVKINKRPWTMTLAKLTERLQKAGNLDNFLTRLTFYGPGHYTAANVELVLLGTRGKPALLPIKCPRQLIFHPGWRGEDHSRKPDAVHKRITKAYPSHTYAELFARRQYPGWLCLGNEIDGLDLRESIPLYLEGNYGQDNTQAIRSDGVGQRPVGSYLNGRLFTDVG